MPVILASESSVPALEAGVLHVHQTGKFDPTVASEPRSWWRATITPDGPGTLHLWWSGVGVDAEAWGPGADWLLGSVPELCGRADDPQPITAGHPNVLEAQRRHPDVRIGRSRRLYHGLLPVVIAQRVTFREATRSWRQLCMAAGAPAPGPRPLRLPPAPDAIARQPYWWFHRFGIERKRADALRAVAAHVVHLERLDEVADVVEATRVLSLIPGVGPWTIGSTLGPCLGDPDAVPVGDYWIPHAVCHALAGEVRGSDERMLELLEPYLGQRGRVLRLLGAEGLHVQRFAPGRRIIPIADW